MIETLKIALITALVLRLINYTDDIGEIILVVNISL